MTVYGYIRVSTGEQNEDRQMDAMEKAHVPLGNIYIDKQSGKDFNRQMYKKMVKKLRKNDILYIKSIDRLGRNYDEIIEQWKHLTKTRKVDIIVLDMPLLDTTRDKDLIGTFMSDIVLQLLSFVAENEMTNIRSRQREGIEAAKGRGVKFGRPKIRMPENTQEIYKGWKEKKINAAEASQMCGVSKSTFYRKVKEFEISTQKQRP